MVNDLPIETGSACQFCYHPATHSVFSIRTGRVVWICGHSPCFNRAVSSLAGIASCTCEFNQEMEKCPIHRGLVTHYPDGYHYDPNPKPLPHVCGVVAPKNCPACLENERKHGPA